MPEGFAPTSVLIPTRQRLAALERALKSLETQTIPADTYEVVVAVDGSTDGTSKMLGRLRPSFGLKVTETGGRGRAAACNAALALAEGDLVVILDDDMEVAPDFLERHRAAHPPGSRRCVMGAVPVRLHHHSPRAARRIAANFEAHMQRLAEPGHVFVPRDFYSGNTSIDADVLRQVGEFDESFNVYGNEDVELGIRLRAAGVEMGYDGTAVAHQAYDKQLSELARDTMAKGTTSVLLARTHPGAFQFLRLARPRDASRSWLVLRSVLLCLTRRWPRLAATVFRLARGAEALGLWRTPLFYRATLDYAFWAGVDQALNSDDDKGALALLGEQLRRGPVDLLLH